MQSILFILTPALPLLLGVYFLFARRLRAAVAGAGFALCFAAVTALALTGDGTQTLFSVAPNVTFVFKSDAAGRLFALLFSGIFMAAGFFSFGYFRHHENPVRFYAFYFFTLFALLSLCLAGSLLTMYLCFETLTLCSFPMVLFDRTKEAVAAGIKYLLYSISGAMMGLFGVIYLTLHTTSATFVAGGSLEAGLIADPPALFLIAFFICMIGFGTKAGIFPMHGWLPTAHPIAPSPASAVLSGVVVNAGVLCIFRVIYFTVGPEAIRGSWAQAALLALSLLTVLIGSAQALRQKHIKRRLAYSTVSQISYILFGLFMLNGLAAQGALLHTVFHSVMKTCLFLCAGAVMVYGGTADVDEMRGIGKAMPVTMWCFTLAGIGLVGIPPMSGFLSKWVLAQGAVQSGISVFAWLGPVVLLVSALLTAGYIAPVVLTAFFPGRQEPVLRAKEAPPGMLVPLIVLAGLTLLFGLYAAPLRSAVDAILQTLM
jgi:formate hydrogenlyase subunit 3/multisubunit Na+/H+ antiporter MnhD subunit